MRRSFRSSALLFATLALVALVLKSFTACAFIVKGACLERGIWVGSETLPVQLSHVFDRSTQHTRCRPVETIDTSISQTHAHPIPPPQPKPRLLHAYAGPQQLPLMRARVSLPTNRRGSVGMFSSQAKLAEQAAKLRAEVCVCWPLACSD